ncbi:hypothetical protein GQ600_9897 [Phytophthora cactorum]|nr:hypothetical protein GQ600_9897 [Phytophthora cactorum]
MQLRYAIVLAIIATQPSNATSKSELNGWYPCSEYIFSDKGSSTGLDAQCAVYSALLCYPEICETLRRLPVTAVDPDTAFNVWLLQGGPGASSTDCKCYLILSASVEALLILFIYLCLKSWYRSGVLDGVTSFRVGRGSKCVHDGSPRNGAKHHA